MWGWIVLHENDLPRQSVFLCPNIVEILSERGVPQEGKELPDLYHLCPWF